MWGAKWFLRCVVMSCEHVCGKIERNMCHIELYIFDHYVDLHALYLSMY